jgi:hypothetical protein
MKKTRGLKSHDNVSLSGHFEQAELRLKSQISHFIAGAGVFFYYSPSMGQQRLSNSVFQDKTRPVKTKIFTKTQSHMKILQLCSTD